MYIYFNWTSLFVTTEMGLLLRLILFGVNILHSTGSFNAEFTRFHPKLSSDTGGSRDHRVVLALQTNSTGSTAKISFRHVPPLLICQCVLVCTPTRSFSHPCELGAHFLSLLDHASLQHVLGTF